MARNRMLHQNFWTSESLRRVSRDARLLFAGLWTFSDDYGVHEDNNRRILGNVFPNDSDINEEVISKLKEELLREEIIIEISYLGHDYLYIPTWKEYQKVSHPGKETIPKDYIENFMKELLELKASTEEYLRVSGGSPAQIEREVEREREVNTSSNEEVGQPEILEQAVDHNLSETYSTPPVPVTPPKKEYGDPRINAILKTLKVVVKVRDFKESQKWQRIYGKNIFDLSKEVGLEKIEEALETLLSSWKKDRCNSLKFLWEELKTLYIPSKNNPSTTLEL